MKKWTHIKDPKNPQFKLLKMYTYKYSYLINMKRCGVEVTYRFRTLGISIPGFNPDFKTPYLIKRILIFFPWKLKKITEWSLKCDCHSAAFSSTECSLKGHWTMPEMRISVSIPWAFSGNVKCFSWLKRKFSSCVIFFWNKMDDKADDFI